MDTDPRLPKWDDWVPLGEHRDEPVNEEFSDPSEHENNPGPKAKIGVDARGREVYYDPGLPGNRLPNGHLTITGESGSGKTQAMKNILADLGLPALVLDFKDDYSDPVYADREGFRVIDPTKMPLPINPLAPAAAKDGSINPTFHSYQLAEIISRIYRLGDIQGFRLREAIKGVYADAGIPMSAHIPDPQQEWPSFQAVKNKLSVDKDNTELIGHMSPIFDFGLFSGKETNLGGLGGAATSPTVIRLAQLPGNEVKNSVAEFFLMALYNYLIREAQTSDLRQVLVLDEAWRLVNSPFLEPLMRESRAFGLGVFVATQFPTDLPLLVSGNAATKLFFGQSSPSQVSEVARIITGKPYGTPLAEEVQDSVRMLKPLHCVLVNKQYEPYVEVTADAYFARTSKESSMRELPSPGRFFNSSKSDTHRTRFAQSDGVPQYICPRCQGPVASAGATCGSCERLVDSLETNLDSESTAESIQERINNVKGGDKVAELQPFPPGEDEEEGPFAPFSMSEWQMVKGPKRRSHVTQDGGDVPEGGVTRFCEGCETAIDEDDWDKPCPVDGRHWQDPTPLGGTHRGINGCDHLHYFPNVTPSGCAYCSGTE